ncbi:MAG: hypothetical protein MJ089_04240 [Ruminococcus sp.]|nr:hypothetical protein [Ruminococcus sp.]
MNYEKIIIELLDRIKTLEEKVAKLEEVKTNQASMGNAGKSEEITGGHKYRALTLYLKKSNFERIKLTFAEIEKIIGSPLSYSARTNRANWANSTSQSLACSWLKVGYKTVEVNLLSEYVVFEKGIY